MVLPYLSRTNFEGHLRFVVTTVYHYDDGYVGKQPEAWKKYCAEYWLKELKESMDKCTGRHNTILK